MLVQEAGGFLQRPTGEDTNWTVLRQAEGETAEVVALEQVFRVEDPAAQIRDVHANEAVGLARVAADLEGARVGGVAYGDVLTHVTGGVGVRGGALVPVLRDPLLATMPLHVARLAADAEEGLEVVTVQIAGRLLFSVVGHEVDDEVVGGGDDDDGAEEAGEEIGVVGDGLVLDRLEAGAKLVQGVAVLFAAEHVHLFELFHAEAVGVAVIGVGVVAPDGGVAFVVVTGDGVSFMLGCLSVSFMRRHTVSRRALGQYQRGHQSGDPSAADHQWTRHLEAGFRW